MQSTPTTRNRTSPVPPEGSLMSASGHYTHQWKHYWHPTHLLTSFIAAFFCWPSHCEIYYYCCTSFYFIHSTVFLEMWVLLLFMYGDTNRSGDACHWKDSLLQFPRGGGTPLPFRATWGSIRLSQEAEGGGNMWTWAFIVVGVGRDQQSKVSRLRIG